MARRDLIFPSLRCQKVWNKMCTQLSLSESKEVESWGCLEILLSFLMWFYGHFWPNNTPTFTSVRVDFGWPLLSSFSTSSFPSQNREYNLETFDWFTASFLWSFCTNASVSVADRLALKQNFMATLCSFLPSMMYKENWLCKASYNLYTVKDYKQNTVCEWMLVDRT